MSTRYRLVELLADGHFRSGEWLGQQLGMTRAAVWKQVGSMAALGLDVQAVRGKGYRLTSPFIPLRVEQICSSLSAAAAARMHKVEVLKEVDSTSDYLKRTSATVAQGQWRMCCAEWQSAGRGRKGRHWVSPYGSSLYLSLAGELNGRVLGSGGLSLAVAIGLLRALQECGVDGAGLKWPNDVYFQGRKLAGILVDLAGESTGMFQVIIGIGINLKLPVTAARAIDQPWADLSQCGVDVDRNRLAALLVDALLPVIDTYAVDGLAAFKTEWQRFDLIAGRAVELHHGNAITNGIARGIDVQGALLLESEGTTRPFHAGEVSVRLY